MPMSFVALPHSTGNTVAVAMPAASALAELGGVDLLVAEVALHEVVVADDDALDERVVHRVLLRLPCRRGPRLRCRFGEPSA